ncbi:MAG: cytochrome c1 [Halothiobacillaceae bacterium]
MKKTIATLLFTLSTLAASGTVVAAGGSQVELQKPDIDLKDGDSMIRGAKTFMAYCATCHSAEFMRYSRIGQDFGLGEEALLDMLVPPGGAIGDTISAGMPDDYAERIFGKAPPDLSVITRARGADWIYTYLLSFYEDDAHTLGSNNAVYKNAGMPNVFVNEQGIQRAVYEMVEQDDGEGEKPRFVGLELAEPGEMSQDAFEAKIRDLVNFMVYMGEPSAIKRQELGPWVLAFILLFTFVAFLLKKEYWRDVKK